MLYFRKYFFHGSDVFRLVYKVVRPRRSCSLVGGLGLVGLLVAWAGPANNSDIPSKRHYGQARQADRHTTQALSFWLGSLLLAQPSTTIHRSRIQATIHIHRGCCLLAGWLACLLACLSAVVHSSISAWSHS